MSLERTVTENIIFDLPMSFPQAVLYGVRTDGTAFVLGSHSDIYALLKNDYSASEGLIGITTQTCGWAAPNNPETGEVDGRPSEHPERRRVVLVVTLTVNGFCSGMKLAQKRRDFTIEETSFEDDEPSGELWDAMNECMKKIMQVIKGDESSNDFLCS